MMPDALKSLVEEFFTLLGYVPEEVVVSSGHRTLVAVQSKDFEHLTGPHGEHLRSINTLLRRLAETKYGEEGTSFLVDINGYHERELEHVRANARMLAQRARLFKHDVELPAMSPYERLVIHELFADDPEIKTESAGEGKFRHVVLKYKRGTPYFTKDSPL